MLCNSLSYLTFSYSRLVSTYQDKFVDKPDVNYHRIVKSIVDKFGDIQFSSYIQMILREGSIQFYYLL